MGENPPHDKRGEPGYPEISYDKLIKTALRTRYPEFVEWLLGEKPLEVRTLEPVQATTVERLGDKLLEVRFANKPNLLLHLEFQLKSDPKLMGARMLQFGALVFELTQLDEHRGKQFLSAVVYLDKTTFSGDPGGIYEEIYPGKVLSYSYEVVKLWELDPERVLSSEWPGLWPFAPLMRGDPEELPRRSTERILSVPDSIMGTQGKQQLLTILGGLS